MVDFVGHALVERKTVIYDFITRLPRSQGEEKLVELREDHHRIGAERRGFLRGIELVH